MLHFIHTLKISFAHSKSLYLMLICLLSTLKTFSQLNPNPPKNTVRLVFIHHSTGEGWLREDQGGLITALNNNNYYVRDTNYDWGPLDEDVNDGTNVGSHTDIGHWYNWFLGPHRSSYLDQLYMNEFLTDGIENSSFITNPGGENQIIMFKSCFTSAQIIYGDKNDPPLPQGQPNPLYGKGVDVDTAYTVSNIKGLYRDVLDYFKTRQDKLFILITTPPSYQGAADEAMPKLRAINTWLVEHLLDNYTFKNVMVFDYYNVLTSNGGNTTLNDIDAPTGSHHRFRNGVIEHLIGNSNYHAYASWDAASHSWDNHPTAEGHQKATSEFLPLLNIAYNRWISTAPSKGHIVCDRTSLDFIADSGQILPSPQALAIINRGNAAMAWSASKTNSWLSLNPTNGSTNVNDTSIVTVHITNTNLPSGVYNDEIVVTSADADNSPKKILVNYTVRSASVPHITLNKSYMNFIADSGSALPGLQTFTIENTGNDLMDWTITNNHSWLDIDPINGETNAGGNSTITVAVNTTELTSGMHRDTLTILSTNADNSPQSIIITYTINSHSLPRITVNKQTLTFSADSGGALPQIQTLTVSNTGGGTLNWTATKKYNWLSIDPISGSLNASESAQITISITTTQLNIRSYVDTILILCPNAENPLEDVMIIYHVAKQNSAPSKFSLMSPTKNDTINLTNPTKPFTFRWHRSTDPDGNVSLLYAFRFYGNQFDTTYTGLTDTIYAFDFMKRLRVSTQYNWYVVASDGMSSTSSDTISLITSSTITSMKNDDAQIAQSFILYQNYPNPFSSTTTINYTLRARCYIILSVYDLYGRELQRLVDEPMHKGMHTVHFYPKELENGVYICKLQTEYGTSIQKMLILH